MKLLDADFGFSSAYMTSRTKRSFWSLNFPAPEGLNRKNTRKNMKFWPLKPYYKRSDWKNWLAFLKLQHLSFKIKKKYLLPQLAEMVWNWIMFTPIWFYQKSSLDPLRNSHMKFTGKNKVGNSMWAKSCTLIGQKWQNNFQ